MVDWMIEVLSSFNCNANTFFVSLDIMDGYLSRTNKRMDVRQIHLIGVTSMLLASKQEEIIPFKVSTVVEKMTHGKIIARDIVLMEIDMLQTMNFNLLQNPSLFVMIEFLLVKMEFHLSKSYKDIVKVITYVSKMLMHDFSIISKFQLKYLAASCIYICLKIVEQVNNEFDTKYYVDKLRKLLNLNESTFFTSSERVLNLAKTFETKFPYSKNLLKFDSFSLEKYH